MGMRKTDCTEFKAGEKEIWAARLSFFLPGFVVATWAPMIPMVKERLSIEADVLGILLLCIGVSAFFTMPIAGMVGRKFGCRCIMVVSSVAMAFILVALSVLPSVYLYGVFLILMGFFMGLTDVNTNINAVVVEKLAKRRLMSGMHAFWSIGGLAGAGLFSLFAHMGLSVLVISVIHCAIILALTAVCAPYFLPYKERSSKRAIAIPKGIVILFGALTCMCFLAEGGIMDWSGVFLREIKGWDISLASLGYAAFSAAMLIMRIIGDKAVQTIGEFKIMVLGSILVSIGFLLIVVIDDFYLMMLPFVLIGVGAANIIPVMYSQLNYQKDMPVGEAVTAVSSMGYTGIILGPAVLGFIAHAMGLVSVFILLAVLMAVQTGISIWAFKR